MPCKYTLEWFDRTVAIKLRLPGHQAGGKSLSDLLAEAEAEATKVQSAIRQQVFSLPTEQQAEVLVRQYHAALIALQDSLEHKEATRRKNCRLQDALDGLIAFLEHSYPRYLSPEEHVPLTYLVNTEAELRQQLNVIGPDLVRLSGDAQLIAIITEALGNFTAHCPGRSIMTFRELSYRRALVHELELLSTCSKSSCILQSVHELLAYMNFNSKAYVTYYTMQLAASLKELEEYSDKIDLLLLSMKEFNQMVRRDGVRLSSDDVDLKTSIEVWFTQELDYLERKMQLSANLVSNEVAPAMKQTTVQKLLCSLSVDQIALLLRSADELKILVSRSMNAIFRTVAPYLSTACRESISPDSMRSKAYVAETRDKEIVIAKLREMIERIKEY